MDIRPVCPRKYGGCGKPLSPEVDLTKTSFERLIIGTALPSVAYMIGCGEVRPPYFVCTNPECRWCWSEKNQNKYYFKFNTSQQIVPVGLLASLGFYPPKPKKKKKD